MSATTTTNYTITGYSVDLMRNVMMITVEHTDAVDGSHVATTRYVVPLATAIPIMDNKARQIAAQTPNSIINGQNTFLAVLQAVLDAAVDKIKP